MTSTAIASRRATNLDTWFSTAMSRPVIVKQEHFRKCWRRVAVSGNVLYGRIAVMQTTRKAGRPHKGERHAFLVKLSPEMVDKIHLLAQINERTYVEVVEVVATDALAARTREEQLDRVTDFVGHKGERRAVKFHLPMAQAVKVFDLSQSTARTYQDVLEFLLGDGLEVYDKVEMLDFIAEGQGRLDVAV